MGKNGTAVTVGIILVLLLIYTLLTKILQIPPDRVTWTYLTLNKDLINEYVEMYHRLPDTLLDLPRAASEGYIVKDGWDNDIRYSHTPDGQVTLSSPGPDKALGEKGAITLKFRVEATLPPGSRPSNAKDQEESKDHER